MASAGKPRKQGAHTPLPVSLGQDTRTHVGYAKTIATLGAGFFLYNLMQTYNWTGPLRALRDDLMRARSPWALPVETGLEVATGLSQLLLVVLVLGAGAAATTFIGRMWRRSPPGTPRDPLIQARDLLRRRPLLGFWPFVYVLPVAISHYVQGVGDDMVGAGVDASSLLIDGLLLVGATKLAVAALNRMADRPADVPQPIATDEIAFRAVAVTPRTQAVVTATFGVSLAMVVAVLQASPSHFFGTHMGTLIAVYAVAMVSLANWFRRASTIAVGVDGVLVHGTSKTKFYAYRDFDSVRVRGAFMALMQGAKTIVRLQLHGDDVTRGEHLADRIRRALLLSKSTSAAEHLATASTAHGQTKQTGLGRASLGAADYRQASLSREQLWELVEADGTAASARAAAAEALALRLDEGERTRLRVAASHCADPNVRVAIEELVHEEMGDDDASATPGALRQARTST